MDTDLANTSAVGIAAVLRSEWDPLPAGSRLPSDRALADRFGIGHGVVARAMADLARQGLVRRRRGAGTFWIGSVEEIAPTTLPSFSAWMVRRGVTPGWRLIGHEARRVASTERAYLELRANSVVWQVRRVFTLDDVPVGVGTSVLPAKDLVGLPAELASYGSLFETLTRRYGLQPTRSWKRTRRAEAPLFVSEALGVRDPVPTRLEESLNRSTDGRPLEYARTFLRDDHLSPESLVRRARARATDRQEHR